MNHLLHCAGVISYFREGCTPIAYVDQLFEEAKAGKTYPPCPLLDSHQASSLQKAAQLLREGKVMMVGQTRLHFILQIKALRKGTTDASSGRER